MIWKNTRTLLFDDPHNLLKVATNWKIPAEDTYQHNVECSSSMRLLNHAHSNISESRQDAFEIHTMIGNLRKGSPRGTYQSTIDRPVFLRTM